MMRVIWYSLATMCTAWSTAAAAAQATYTVFPVNTTAEAPPAVPQPTGPSSAASVTLTVQDSSIRYVVNNLAHQAHLRPVYDNDNPLLNKRVTLRVHDANVMDAFTAALKGTGLAALIAPDGETIIIRGRRAGVTGVRSVEVGGIVAGRVVDSTSGQGLGGASVKIEGTKLSAVTSDSGHFTLKEVPAGDQVLSVKLFGYKPVVRTVTVVDSQRTMVRIVMASVPTVLSGVVTTATGLQRKVEVGNDITTLNVDSIRQVAPITSVTDLLETRVPGLTVQHTSGDPGSPSRIRLRGASSITGSNDPIVIVNGIRVYAAQSEGRNQFSGGSDIGAAAGAQDAGSVAQRAGNTFAAPSPLDQIDPSSIETIEVFKGPSASALYGSDAANGVIVITTKQGRAGPTRWTADLGAGINDEPGSWPVNYYRFGNSVANRVALNVGAQCAWNDVTCRTDSIVAFQALNDPRYTIFGQGHNQTADLMISGGVPTVQYSLTGSLGGDVGLLKLPESEQQRYERFYGPIPGWMVRPDNYQTWGMNGSMTFTPHPGTWVQISSSLFNSAQQTSMLQGALTQLEGTYVNPDSLLSTPLLQNEFQRATSKSLTSTNSISLHWEPWTWLPLDVTGGLSTVQRTDETLIPYGVNNSDIGNLTGFNAQDTLGSYGIQRGTSQNQTLQVGTTLPAGIVTVATGVNLQAQSTADIGAYTPQLAPGVTVPTSFPTTGCGNNSSGGCSTFSQSTSALATYGWYIQPQFNFNSRFFVNPGFQFGGGSASGANAGLTAWPKVDFSYLAVDPAHPKGVVSLFRPRLAFGYAGTQPDPTWKLRLLNVGGTPVEALNDSTTVPLVVLGTLGNTHLHPERSSELEGGADLELWRGRLALKYTLYDKTRHDAIVPVPVAVSAGGDLGGGQSYENIGVVRNTGTEVEWTAQILESRALSWMIGGNFSNDKNVVVRLNRGVSTLLLPGGDRIEAGFPLFSQWVTPIVSFADVNRDGIIEPTEIRYGDSAIYAGQQAPKYQMNFNTGVTLFSGRLSLMATFAYQNGLTQFNAGAFESGALQLLPNAPGASLATQAAVGSCQTPSLGLPGNNTSLSITNNCMGLIQTINTFRFQALSVNYTVPSVLSRWFRVPRAMLSLKGSNLGLHTNYRGKDPGVNAFQTATSGDLTADFGQIPDPRTWWLTVSLGN